VPAQDAGLTDLGQLRRLGPPLLQTEVGRVALVDQWERTAAAFGQNVDDQQYAALEDAAANGPAYAALSSFVSGPVMTLAVAALLLAIFKRGPGGGPTFPQVLAVVAHAGVILTLRQVIAAPLDYARETLASPMTMTAFFSMLDEASPIARFFGIIDLFVVWWLAVLAIGLSVLYRRPARRMLIGLVSAYFALALLLVMAMAVTGGTV